MGYQESGFEKAILNVGQHLSFDENPTTTSFNNGTITLSSGSPSISTTTGNAFLSGSSGSGIRIDPVSGANSHSLDINFSSPVYAFGFDLVDVFDCDQKNDDNISYEVYADGQKIIEISGLNIGASQTGSKNVYDGTGNLKGSFTVGQNQENFIGFISLEAISMISIIATYGKLSAIDFHGIDKFAYLSNFPCRDTDSDGIPNSQDLDSDNDGIPDIVEAGAADTDGDGRVDNALDSDSDGLADVFESSFGSSSVLMDPDGDGINEVDGDFDSDQLPNWLDLDSDGDGILDLIEQGGTDTNQDGQIDNYSTDTDADGLADAVDGDVGNDGIAENTVSALLTTSSDLDADALPDSGYPHANTDGNGYPDYLDIDADGDGIVDNTEGQGTTSFSTPTGTDTDGDGIDNSYDNSSGFGGNGILVEDTDGDLAPDFQDTDTDEDGILDQIEGHDPDGDYVADANSPSNTGVPTGLDLDLDGLDDGYDNNTSLADPTNAGLNPASHPNYNGAWDQDWRAQSTLEISYTFFEAQLTDRQVLLKWELDRDLVGEKFQLLRKMEGEPFFQKIAELPSDLSASYSYTDMRIPVQGNGKRFYYQLSRKSLNGMLSKSKIIEVELEPLPLQIEIFPNPVAEQLHLRSEKNNLSGHRIRLINPQGKIVFRKAFRRTAREELILNCSKFPSGVYTLKVELEEEEKLFRILFFQ